ncbi:Rdx family protein [bacterium]|nr:Rdx family protein [bacterium]MBP9810777.1 Rdx family protein [bacterium]
MAADIARILDYPTKIHQSSGGVFEIEVDGELIFSKAKLGRFPAEGEVLDLLSSRAVS